MSKTSADSSGGCLEIFVLGIIFVLLVLTFCVIGTTIVLLVLTFCKMVGVIPG
jgi:uncharacterized integral membrane protein